MRPGSSIVSRLNQLLAQLGRRGRRGECSHFGYLPKFSQVPGLVFFQPSDNAWSLKPLGQVSFDDGQFKDVFAVTLFSMDEWLEYDRG